MSTHEWKEARDVRTLAGALESLTRLHRIGEKSRARGPCHALQASTRPSFIWRRTCPRLWRYVYDATAGGNLGKGALTSISDESGSTAFTYDHRPGVAKVTTTIGGKTYSVSYQYDAAGRVTQLTYPDRRLVSYAYDSSGRPTTIAMADVFNGRPFKNLATGIALHPFSDTVTALSHANDANATLTVDTRTLDLDGRIAASGVTRSATTLASHTLAYADGINLTGITDTLNSANNESYSYTPSNRLGNTSGPWGSLNFATDGVGNRTSQVLTSGTTTTDVYALASGTNRIASVTTNGTLSRSFTYNAAGDILTDTKGGVTTIHSYSDAGRMASLTVGSVGQGPYLYNGFAQLASRTVTANPTKTFHMLYDQSGNLIAEANAATGEILREYFWLGGRPVAVMDSSADHAIYAVHVDHLDRPRMMTDWNGAVVWRADYLPFGEVRTTSGPASLTLRFPGQWFMLETGLHYNWHRWYDASTGRYTQPDPIGMPDGPSRYAYGLNSPLMLTDREGTFAASGDPALFDASGKCDVQPDGLIQLADWRDWAIRVYCLICFKAPPKTTPRPPPPTVSIEDSRKR